MLSAMGLLEPVRRLRWRRRVEAKRQRQLNRFQLGSRDYLPRVFANGMAKSGSHILEQYLEGLERVTPLVLTDIHPIRTYDEAGQVRPPERVLRELNRLRAGDMAWGYLPAKKPYLDWLAAAGLVAYFVYRDPRDRIVSHIFFASEIHEGHAMRDYYQGIETMEQKINDTICGVPGLIEDIRSAYQSYLGWFEVDSVLKVRFEDLVNDKRQTVNLLLDFLLSHQVELAMGRSSVVDSLIEAMAPRHSPTFRSGQSGGWQQHFTERNKEVFKQVAGDLLLTLGYETSNDW
jgi:hypothetical protein